MASLRGLALGDAFGETWFFQPAEVLETALVQRWEPRGPWPWTDDTAMALALLKVLHGHGTVDQGALATEFARGYAADPDRGYGTSMSTVLPALGDGADWAALTGRQFGGRGSWGNGAAMRVAPLGAWFAGDLDRVVAEAIRSAVVTHAHPEAAAGAVAVAVAAALSVGGTAAGELVAAVADRVPDGEVAARLRRAREIPHTDDPRDAAAVLGCGHRVSAADTVPYAVWCAARHLDDPVEALWATVLAGGDMDTTCAIVGGIVAAGTGLDRVPAEWLAACEPLPAWVDRVAA
ncbi:hydrolase [Rugosimonospora africana]|uniref:Hydrolase n=1 Tax=Rugosimonospora africana TaxID=556532 RepID=A0A8J3VTH7_9ACTN|nr:hydrolase [Rugosimonospora africana]